MLFSMTDFGFRGPAMRGAERLMWELKTLSITPPVSAYHSMMHGFGALGDVTKVRGYLDEFRKLGYEPNVVTKALIVEAYANNNDEGKGGEMLRKIWARGTTPTTDHFCSLAKAIRMSGGSSAEMEAVLQEMRLQGLRPDRSVFIEAVLTCAQSRDVEALMRVITSARVHFGVSFEYDTVVRVLTALVSAQADSHNPLPVLLKRMMLEPKEQINVEQRGQYYEALVIAHGLEDELAPAKVAFKQAMRLRREVGKEHLDNRTSATMIQLLVHNNEAEGSDRLKTRDCFLMQQCESYFSSVPKKPNFVFYATNLGALELFEGSNMDHALRKALFLAARSVFSPFCLDEPNVEITTSAVRVAAWSASIVQTFCAGEREVAVRKLHEAKELGVMIEDVNMYNVLLADAAVTQYIDEVSFPIAKIRHHSPRNGDRNLPLAKHAIEMEI